MTAEDARRIRDVAKQHTEMLTAKLVDQCLVETAHTIKEAAANGRDSCYFTGARHAGEEVRSRVVNALERLGFQARSDDDNDIEVMW